MIFPPIRISQLSRDVEQKRAALELSQAALTAEVRRKLSPFTFLREHPQLLAGAALSLFSAGGGLKKILGLILPGLNGHSKNGHVKGKRGVLAGLLRFGGRTAVRTVMPVAISAVRYALKSLFRTFRTRRA